MILLRQPKSVRLIMRPIHSLIDKAGLLGQLDFDSEKKALIFEHQKGIRDLKWMVRGTTAFSLLNTFLTVSEISNPMFGGFNLLSFGGCTFIGYLGMLMTHLVSRRTIHKLYLSRDGHYVHILFFNAFWKPQQTSFHISEFEYRQPSYLGYIKTELTSYGYVWIDINKNQNEHFNPTVDTVISGKKVDFLESIRKKLNKY